MAVHATSASMHATGLYKDANMHWKYKDSQP